jgi:hypothetical protein
VEALAHALVGRVEPEQPLAVHQVAAGRPVGVERLGRRHVGGPRGGWHERREHREQGEREESEEPHHGESQHPARRQVAQSCRFEA